MSDIPEMQWISVDDSMPMVGMNLLVVLKDGSIDVQQCYNDGGWRPCWADGWRKGQQFEITHWMKVRTPSAQLDK